MPSGTFYIIATPIGNLQDITYRAVSILQSVSTILVEDKRHAQKLLTHIYAYPTIIAQDTDKTMQKTSRRPQILSYHQHNEKIMTGKIEKMLQDGHDIALISDAGTPVISDPGFVAIAFLRAKNYSIIPIPGANACISALSAAGLLCDNFMFCGFLPAKKKQRQDYYTQLCNNNIAVSTFVFYVAPHDIMDILLEIDTVFTQYDMVLARELTKIYEEFITGDATHIRQYLEENNKIRGEMVLLLSPKYTGQDHEETYEKCHQLLALCQNQQMSQKDMVSFVQQFLSLPKRTIYQLALQYS